MPRCTRIVLGIVEYLGSQNYNGWLFDIRLTMRLLCPPINAFVWSQMTAHEARAYFVTKKTNYYSFIIIVIEHIAPPTFLIKLSITKRSLFRSLVDCSDRPCNAQGQGVLTCMFATTTMQCCNCFN